MQGSQENPILIDDSPVKLIVTECNLLPSQFGQCAQKQLELYCRLHQKEKLIQAKLDRLAVHQTNAIYSPERSDKLWARSTTGHRILNRIFKQKLRIFDKAYDEGWHSWLPDHVASEDQSPAPRIAAPSSLTSSNDFPKTQLPSLLRVLSDEAAGPRNRLLTMMALELGCNEPILLALSVAWPEPVRVVWPFSPDPGFRFIFAWESEGTFHGRQKGVQLVYEHVTDELVLVADVKTCLRFHPSNVYECWTRQWASWPALFARFDIKME